MSPEERRAFDELVANNPDIDDIGTSIAHTWAEIETRLADLSSNSLVAVPVGDLLLLETRKALRTFDAQKDFVLYVLRIHNEVRIVDSGNTNTVKFGWA